MFLRQREPLSFERSVPGKRGMDLPRLDVPVAQDTRPAHLKRSGFDALPELSEVEVIRPSSTSLCSATPATTPRCRRSA